jgi:hypothetical protein
LLRHQDKGTFRSVTGSHLTFSKCDFFQRAAQVHRARVSAFIGFPGHRAIERIIDFENARCVLEMFEPAVVVDRQALARDPQQLPRCDVEKNRASGR